RPGAKGNLPDFAQQPAHPRELAGVAVLAGDQGLQALKRRLGRCEVAAGGEAAALDEAAGLLPLHLEARGLGAGAVGELAVLTVEPRPQAGAPDAAAVVLADNEQLGLGERAGQAPAVA